MSEEEYDMNHESRGMVLIINIKSFEDGDSRDGAAFDNTNLRISLPFLGFDPELIHVNETDYNGEEFRAKIRDYIGVDHIKYDCFFCFIMSHGRAGGIVYSYDFSEICIKDDIVNVINSCVTLENKPKIFFIVACRDNPNQEEVDASMYDFTGSDYCICYATSENSTAFRDPDEGTLYIIAVCKIFRENAPTYHRSLSDMIPKMENEVREIQLAEHIPHLNKLVYFQTENKIANNLEAKLKFFNREIELEIIRSTLEIQQGIIISGPNGIGKTALANEYGHRVKDEQEMIVRFFYCDTNQFMEDQFKHFSSLILGEDYDDNISIDVLIQTTNQKLKSNQKFLIILDNVTRYQDIEAYLRDLPTQSTKIIITTPDYETFNYPNGMGHLRLNEFEINENDQEAMRKLKEFIQNGSERNLNETQLMNFINAIRTDNSTIHPQTLVSNLISLRYN